MPSSTSPIFSAIYSPLNLSHSKLLAGTDSSCRMTTHWQQCSKLRSTTVLQSSC